MEISSVHNETVKEVVRLRRKREDNDPIVVEGVHETSMALQAGLQPVRFFYCPELIKAKVELDIDPALKVECTLAVFEKLSVRDNPDGVIVLFEAPSPARLPAQPGSLYLLLEGLEKPGNLGAIIRTAMATGVDAIIVTEARTDIYNHNVIRASRGAVFSARIILTDNETAYNWFRENGIKILVTTPKSRKVYSSVDLKEKIVVVIGEEHKGIGEFWLKNADEQIIIPMKKAIDSLNASVSTGIVLYEIFRQRGFKSTKT
jgi:TrmH family RNA methyltransferase